MKIIQFCISFLGLISTVNFDNKQEILKIAGKENLSFLPCQILASEEANSPHQYCAQVSKYGWLWLKKKDTSCSTYTFDHSDCSPSSCLQIKVNEDKRNNGYYNGRFWDVRNKGWVGVYPSSAVCWCPKKEFQNSWTFYCASGNCKNKELKSYIYNSDPYLGVGSGGKKVYFYISCGEQISKEPQSYKKT